MDKTLQSENVGAIKHSTAPKRERHERRADQQMAVFLAAAGYSQEAIATAINERSNGKYAITRQQVQYDIAKNLKSYEPLAPANQKDAQLLQIARLQLVYELAMDGYIASSANTTTTTRNGKEVEQVTRTTKRSAGDAKFLALILDVEKERNKMLGTYAPERKEQIGELTVTFAWKDAERLPAPAEDAGYMLVDDNETDE